MLPSLHAVLWFLFCAANPADVIHAERIDGQAVAGSWVGLNGQEVVLQQEDRQIRLPLSDLLNLSWTVKDATTSTPATASAPADWPTRLFLKDGSEIPARIEAGDARTLTVQTRLIDHLNVPVNTLAAIRFLTSSPPGVDDAFANALAERRDTEDTLLVAAGDNIRTLIGVVESLTSEGGSFRWRQQRIPIQTDRTVGIVFASTAESGPAAATACRTRDGSIWAGQLVRGDREAVLLKLAAGQDIRIPVRGLSGIRINSDRVKFLDELQPTGYEFEPLGATRRPWRRNRSVANNPLRIAGNSFERGIGMHSKATLSYELTGDFSRFAAVVGIDDGARPRGSVVFRVTADGKEVFNSGPVIGQDQPRPILVDIHQARKLKLIVDYGEDLDVGDHANWCDARLIR
ncbi:MAG TPA: NPCBM/NEW2 domain-containing protein [Phycisphaerae bacterium]|nr:NPCBM/NEW2 domain-containing protein [Phycisphaerae bacterium]